MKKTIILTIILFTVQFLAPILGQNEQKPRLVVQDNLLQDIDFEDGIFSQDGKIYADGGSISVKVFDVATGRKINDFTFPTVEGQDAHTSYAFSPNENKLAIFNGTTLYIWNYKTGKAIRKEPKLPNVAFQNNIYFSPDGKVLFIVYEEYLTTYYLQTGKTVISKKIETNIFDREAELKFMGKRIIAPYSKLELIELKINEETDEKSTENCSEEPQAKFAIREKATGKIINVITNPNLANYGKWGFEKWYSLFTNYGLYSVLCNKLRDEMSHKTFDFYKSVLSPIETKIAKYENGRIKITDFKTSEEKYILENLNDNQFPIKFSNTGRYLVFGNLDKNNIFDTKKGLITYGLKDLSLSEGNVFVFSPNDRYILYTNDNYYEKGMPIFDLETDIEKILPTNEIGENFLNSATFSPDESKVVIISDGLEARGNSSTVMLWDVARASLIGKFVGHELNVTSVAFSPDGKTIATASLDLTVRIWDVQTRKEIKRFNINGEFAQLQFSPNGRFLLANDDKGVTDVFDINKNVQLMRLFRFQNDDWVITTPEGRFDTNKLENPQGLHWIMPDAPFTPLSFEVFMRDYYEPNLLPRLLKCTEENNCDKEFKPVRNLTELNRTQPKVSITNIKPTDAADVVQVTVEAEDVISEYQKDKQGKALRSGVYDVRLFRDGQLVGYTPDAEGAVELDKNGKFSKSFTIKLPKNTDAKDFNFTAYAFNSDRVKSENANQTYTLPTPLPKVKGKALLLTIGVNRYDNPRYNLRYAANDARKMQETVGARLKAEVGSKYSEVVQIPLISDNDVGKESNNARKDIIKGVFSLLAGRREEVPKDVLERIEKIARVPAVEPEDTLIIAFSGHGYADQNGIFYMLPADIPKDITSLTNESLKSMISSDELSLWMRDITAEEMLMIVDACHSAAAVQGKDFKPGPMGSRGLGQLAYDKGMRILAATQSDNVALEFSKLQQGLLSYVLIKEGIEDKKADTEPKPDELIATEWLGYAVKQVPQLYQDILAGKRGVLIDGKAVVVGQKGSEALNLPGSQVKSGVNLQQPSLFDFRRRNNKNVLFQLQK